MLIVVGNAKVVARQRDRMMRACEAMVTASRLEEGCAGYNYAFDILEPEMMRVIELWRDEAALRFHFRTPHMAAFLGELAAMGSRPDIVVYEAGNPHPISGYAPGR
ncbi:Putative monooxygenase YcnE [Alphaproteobacteria bacterium SO-S41]|nr:Putative monooxygenase YcnE [Alphaproteobacteria bacterium SO-S41]